MGLFSRKPAGDLNLTYSAVGGYAVGWLPFSEKAIQLAFAHLDVRPMTVPAYNNGTEAGFGLFDGDRADPALCITQDGNSGYAFSVTAHDGQALCLGTYRVGETRLGDFRDDHIEEAGFWVDGSKITVMAGLTDYGAQYSARYIFLPPADYRGDLRKAGADTWRDCLLSEARFFVSGRRIRPTSDIDPAGGVKLVKKHRGQAAQPVQPGPNAGGGDPVALLLKGLYSPKDAQKSYLKLAEVIVHNADTATVKTKIKEVFQNHEQPEDVALRMSEIFNEDRETAFLLPLDWKAEPADLSRAVSMALGDEIQQVSLPDIKDGTVSSPGVFDSYAQALQAAGFDLWMVETQSDTYCLFVGRKKDRKRIAKLFVPTQADATPFAT